MSEARLRLRRPSFCWRLDKLVKRLPHALDLIEWIGWDRLLFASEYPHWEFDDPAAVLPFPVTDSQRRGFGYDNARALYGP